MNKKWKRFCNERTILILINKNTQKTPHVERFNRTLKDIITKFLTYYERKRFLPYLSKFLKSYNHRYHRMIKCSPFEAEKDENQDLVCRNLHNYYDRFKTRKPDLNIGDAFRISIEKEKFAKGCNPCLVLQKSV